MADTQQTTHVISLGAGVQSSVMLLMAQAGLIRPMPAAAIFADTGWEPSAIYEHLDWLEEQARDIPLRRVSNGRDLYDDTWNGVSYDGHHYGDIPLFSIHQGRGIMMPRQCTDKYKIRPINTQIRELVNRRPRARNGPTAVQWLGITKDEVIRMKPNRASFITNRWPLIELDMTRADCVRWFAARYPGRPLVKSACVGCPFHSDAHWLELARTEPDATAAAVALDRRLRDPDRPRPTGSDHTPLYLHRSRRPLEEALALLDANDRAGVQLSMFDSFAEECEGHCSV